jgi:hypothetical protein
VKSQNAHRARGVLLSARLLPEVGYTSTTFLRTLNSTQLVDQLNHDWFHGAVLAEEIINALR